MLSLFLLTFPTAQTEGPEKSSFQLGLSILDPGSSACNELAVKQASTCTLVASGTTSIALT